MSNLKTKTAFVTGASKGIGAGIALELARSGASVIVNYASDKNGAEAVVRSIVDGGGRSIAIQGDVSNSADVTRMFDQAAIALGSIDVLVNNAGVYQAMPITQMTESEFHREMNVNLLGPMLTIREALKHFRSSGGSIINIGSAHHGRYQLSSQFTRPARAASMRLLECWPRNWPLVVFESTPSIQVLLSAKVPRKRGYMALEAISRKRSLV